MSESIYVIGDIHGQAEQFDAALERIYSDGGRAARIVLLGDLVDRGPASRGVLERVTAAQAAGRDWRVVKGNHDAMFQAFLEPGGMGRHPAGRQWLNESIGGPATLASYGIFSAPGETAAQLAERARHAVPASHLLLLRAMPLYIAEGPYLFVHAGIRPGVPLEEQDPEDMMWIRDEFLNDQRDHSHLVIHGHSPAREPEHRGNRVNLDSGAGWGRQLTAAVLEEGRVFVLEEDGRRELQPAARWPLGRRST